MMLLPPRDHSTAVARYLDKTHPLQQAAAASAMAWLDPAPRTRPHLVRASQVSKGGGLWETVRDLLPPGAIDA